MEVILLEKMRHLGSLGDTVKVKPGFGRNYLIPQGKAVYATPDNIAKFEVKRAELEKIAAEKSAAAVTRQQAIAALPVVVIYAKTGEEGKLFGSISTRDIADAINKAGVAVERSEIDLPLGPIRQVGEYDITLELHGDLTAVVKIQVAAEVQG